MRPPTKVPSPVAPAPNAALLNPLTPRAASPVSPGSGTGTNPVSPLLGTEASPFRPIGGATPGGIAHTLPFKVDRVLASARRKASLR